MIQVIVGTNTQRKTVNTEITNTIKSVLDAEGIDTYGSMVNLDGEILSASDLHSTFEQLDVKDGNSVRLTCVVKAQGAN